MCYVISPAIRSNHVSSHAKPLYPIPHGALPMADRRIPHFRVLRLSCSHKPYQPLNPRFAPDRVKALSFFASVPVCCWSCSIPRLVSKFCTRQLSAMLGLLNAPTPDTRPRKHACKFCPKAFKRAEHCVRHERARMQSILSDRLFSLPAQPI